MPLHGHWPPYVLYPSAPDEGRLNPERVETHTDGADWFEAVKTGQIQVGQRLPLDIVLKNLLVPIAGVLKHAEGMKRLADTDLTEWINLTRRLAREIPYGGPLRGDMLATADNLERVRKSFTRHLRSDFKLRGMRQELQVRLNSLVFSVDRILRTVKELEPVWAEMRADERGSAQYLHFEVAGAWKRWLRPLGVAAKAVSDDAMRERLTRFKKDIRAHHEDALIRDVLVDVLTYGSFLPDGTLRYSPTVPPP